MMCATTCKPRTKLNKQLSLGLALVYIRIKQNRSLCKFTFFIYLTKPQIINNLPFDSF